MDLPCHSCLDRLRRRDFEFVARALDPETPAAEEALYRLLLDRDSLVKLLDEEIVRAAVLDEVMPLSISPELYFYVLVRRALRDATIEDVGIAEYVGSLLASYAYGKKGSASTAPMEQDLDYHIDVMQALDRASPYERFFLQLNCGNRFLFLTGLFPRFLRTRRDRRGAPDLPYYEDLARQAYLAASHHPLASEFATRSLYESLAFSLPSTRRALNQLADHHFFWIPEAAEELQPSDSVR